MKMKFPFLLVSTLIILSMAFAAMAATPTLTVNWMAPTQNGDGTAITGAITYQLYVGPTGKEVKFGNPVTSPPYVITTGIPAPGGTICVQVTATVNAIESARTPEACATIPYPRPGSPVQVSVTVK